MTPDILPAFLAGEQLLLGIVCADHNDREKHVRTIVNDELRPDNVVIPLGLYDTPGGLRIGVWSFQEDYLVYLDGPGARHYFFGMRWQLPDNLEDWVFHLIERHLRESRHTPRFCIIEGGCPH